MFAPEKKLNNFSVFQIALAVGNVDPLHVRVSISLFMEPWEAFETKEANVKHRPFSKSRRPSWKHKA